MAKQYPTLAYRDLTPREADFLHPGHWGGQTIGTNPVTRHRQVQLGVQLGARMVLESERMHDVFRTQYPAGRVLHFGQGSEFRAADHPDKIIVLDQSTAMSRAAFRLEPGEFPPRPSYAFPQEPVQGVWMSEPHSVLLREPSPVIRTTAPVAVGANTAPVETELNVRGSSLGNRLPLRAVGVQVGVLCVPEVIQVGAVEHTIIPHGGQEMLNLTHNVFVFPRILS
jgi:hypothetical protein